MSSPSLPNAGDGKPLPAYPGRARAAPFRTTSEAGIHPPGDGAGRKRKVFTNS